MTKVNSDQELLAFGSWPPPPWSYMPWAAPRNAPLRLVWSDQPKAPAAGRRGRKKNTQNPWNFRRKIRVTAVWKNNNFKDVDSNKDCRNFCLKRKAAKSPRSLRCLQVLWLGFGNRSEGFMVFFVCQKVIPAWIAVVWFEQMDTWNKSCLVEVSYFQTPAIFGSPKPFNLKNFALICRIADPHRRAPLTVERPPGFKEKTRSSACTWLKNSLPRRLLVARSSTIFQSPHWVFSNPWGPNYLKRLDTSLKLT